MCYLPGWQAAPAAVGSLVCTLRPASYDRRQHRDIARIWQGLMQLDRAYALFCQKPSLTAACAAHQHPNSFDRSHSLSPLHTSCPVHLCMSMPAKPSGPGLVAGVVQVSGRNEVGTPNCFRTLVPAQPEPDRHPQGPEGRQRAIGRHAPASVLSSPSAVLSPTMPYADASCPICYRGDGGLLGSRALFTLTCMAPERFSQG